MIITMGTNRGLHTYVCFLELSTSVAMSTPSAQILVSKDYSPVNGTRTPGKMVGSRTRAVTTR